MKSHLAYLRYVLRHKWFVLLAGIRLRVPIWRLVFHDWVKFLPCEWGPYVHFFYSNGMTRGEAAALDYNFPIDTPIELAFEMAWNHHQKHQDHHYQYWVRIGDDGSVLALPMPPVCAREMVADWRGAGRALGKPDTVAWYNANKEKMLLHPSTREWVEEELRIKESIDRTERAFKSGLWG